MGRGRSKAKQTKVARDLKYHSQDIDIDRLAKELHGEVDKNSDEDDFDPFAEGNYIHVSKGLFHAPNSVCSIAESIRTNRGILAC
jgi:hypothetical protein